MKFVNSWLNIGMDSARFVRVGVGVGELRLWRRCGS